MATVEIIIPAGDSEFAVLPPQSGDLEEASHHDAVIAELRRRAGRTEPWHLALLGAIGQWSRPSEYAAGGYWRYVIGGEALDWLTLAQRLCLEIPDAVPPHELEALLFRGQLPQRISQERFRELVGPYRYTAILNFRYGVVVEEAVQLVLEDSIRKNRMARCYQDSEEVVAEAYRHLYGDVQANLAEQFLEESDGLWGCDLESMPLPAWQEFTYWLFKRRVKKWHPARVASDTRRGLERLRELHDSHDEASIYGSEIGADAAPALLSGAAR